MSFAPHVNAGQHLDKASNTSTCCGFVDVRGALADEHLPGTEARTCVATSTEPLRGDSGTALNDGFKNMGARQRARARTLTRRSTLT